MEITKIISMDVDSKKTSWFGFLIKTWCWRGTKVPRKDRFSHCCTLIGIKFPRGEVEYIFTAEEKYRTYHADKYLPDYDIINTCDVVKEFNLSEEDKLKILDRAESYLGIKYGKMSIIGIILNDLWNVVTFGVDGTNKLICSESEVRLYKEWLKNYPDIPDYIDPLERGELFNMKKVER